jgi:uncharacterized protein
MRRALAPILALLALAAAPIAGTGAQQQAPEFPPLTGRVVDRAGVLSEAEERELDAALAAHERATTDQIVVATVDSLQGYPIEEYGYQLGRAWGIGQEGRDNGALLIVAPEEREVRIEVGYGLEGELTDALSRTIIETEILPRFRQGDFGGGIRAGVAAMLRAVGGTYDPAVAPVRVAERDDRAPSPFPLAMMLPIILIFAFNRLFGGRGRGRGRRRGYGPIIVPGGWGGGRGGGGFGGGGGGFGGGGGGFGGGGASGRW